MIQCNKKALFNKTILLLLSGGIDSAACIPFLMEQKAKIQCLYINYGNISSTMESNSAHNLADYYNLPISEIKIDMKKTFYSGEIMGRNAIFILVALLTQYPDIDIITMGIHSGTPYYDSSSLFVERMQILLDEYTKHKISLFMPFIDWNKADIYQYAKEKNIPINLTYSCENGLTEPCKICDSCKSRERIENAYKN